MRRFTVLVSLVAAMLLGILVLHAQPVVVAQEATPGPEGVTYEPFSFALSVALASPSDLFIARVGLEPGTGFPIEESDPSLGIVSAPSLR